MISSGPASRPTAEVRLDQAIYARKREVSTTFPYKMSLDAANLPKHGFNFERKAGLLFKASRFLG